MIECAQRRLTAIVSADAVDYSRLMGQDEHGTLTALKSHGAELIDEATASHGIHLRAASNAWLAHGR